LLGLVRLAKIAAGVVRGRGAEIGDVPVVDVIPRVARFLARLRLAAIPVGLRKAIIIWGRHGEPEKGSDGQATFHHHLW